MVTLLFFVFLKSNFYQLHLCPIFYFFSKVTHLSIFYHAFFSPKYFEHVMHMQVCGPESSVTLLLLGVSRISERAFIHCSTVFFIMNQNRILGEVSEKIELIVALVFENYKSLDESLPSGMADVFKPATRVAAPALSPALKLYSLLNDILSPEAQLKLCRYFQVRETIFLLSFSSKEWKM